MAHSIQVVNVYEILKNLIERPLAPKPYRELRNYYAAKGMANEAEAIGHLIEKRFGKNESPDGPPADPQPRNSD